MADLVVSPHLRTELQHLASGVSKRKGSVLFRRGDPVAGVFLIRKGKVRLQLEADSRLYPARTLGPGSIVGLPATLSGAPYSVTAEVREDAELGFVSRQDFLALIASDTALCLQAMNLISQEIAGVRSAIGSRETRKAVPANKS